MSHWQKTKLKHKVGDRKKEIENHFGIKKAKVSVKEYKEFLETTSISLKKSKSKKKSK